MEGNNHRCITERLGSPVRWQTDFWSLVDHPNAVAYKLPGDDGC